jgi:hypothetical protein
MKLIATYEDPTFERYDRPADQWREWKRQANQLPLAELRRHASVSTSNGHSCVDCFCCACESLLDEERRQNRMTHA